MNQLPVSMRYVDMNGVGDESVLSIKTGALPQVKSDELLIKVVASGINRPDILQRQGAYPPPKDASPVLGLEVAGTVVALGNACEGWRIGDEVCALVNGGGYAEYAAAPQGQCLKIPKGLSMEQAACLPEGAFTVWHNLFERGRLVAGERVLIHGGSSGIGTLAIQWAKAIGATVYVTAGTDEKCKRCEQLGANRAINYRTEDFVNVLEAETQGQGVDVILDMVGGDYVQKNLKVASADGRIVSIAFLAGAKQELNLLPVLLKRLTLTGSTLRAQSSLVKAEMAKKILENLWPLIATKKVIPYVNQTFAFADIAQAHRALDATNSFGKVAITIVEQPTS